MIYYNTYMCNLLKDRTLYTELSTYVICQRAQTSETTYRLRFPRKNNFNS